MGLNNIQKSNKKVLDRPMFAKMKNGELKKILYAQDGTEVYRPREDVKKSWSKFFDFLNPIGGEYNIIGINEDGKLYSQAIEDITGADEATKKIKALDPDRKIGLFEYLPFYSGLGDWNFKPEVVRPGEKEPTLEEIEKKRSAPSDEQKKRDKEDEQQGPEKKEKEVVEVTDLKEEIKSGNLDDQIREKIEIFEKYLGKDTDKKKEAAKNEAMIQFGLNLASSRGGNLMEKIATSAKDPLSNYAKVGKEILNRAEKIKEAGIESGIQSFEKIQDREFEERIEREKSAADIKIQELKNEAAKKSRAEFVGDAVANILADENARFSFTSVAYDADGNRLPEYANITDAQIVAEQIQEVWQSANPTRIPAGEAGFAVFEALPSGAYYLDEETNQVRKKP
tara:strand:- start:738 stop:1925 length:1188 start_codon:yes stop_codon:yes gene_type:complete